MKAVVMVAVKVANLRVDNSNSSILKPVNSSKNTPRNNTKKIHAKVLT